MNSKSRAKAVIREIVRVAGGSLQGKVRLYKVFYFAHLFYAREHPDLLSEWPIVRMPHGPGIDKADSLLDELIESGHLEVRECHLGPYPSVEFRIVENSIPDLDLPAIDAIRKAYQFAEKYEASDLSEMTHQFSRSWQQAQNGEELDIYLDLLDDAEFEQRMASMRKTQDSVKQYW